MSPANLERLRNKIGEYCQLVGKRQKNLASELGYNPSSFCHKLNGTNNAMLTRSDIKSIIFKLVEWEAIDNQTQVVELLELAGIPITIFTAQEWDNPQLRNLRHNISVFPAVPSYLTNHPKNTLVNSSSSQTVTITLNLNTAVALANLIQVMDKDLRQILEELATYQTSSIEKEAV